MSIPRDKALSRIENKVRGKFSKMTKIGFQQLAESKKEVVASNPPWLNMVEHCISPPGGGGQYGPFGPTGNVNGGPGTTRNDPFLAKKWTKNAKH